MILDETQHDLDALHALGQGPMAPSKNLEAIRIDKSINVTLVSDELLANCPVTHQPDFYEAHIELFGTGFTIETKSLKLYLQTFRDNHILAESLAGVIADDIRKAMERPGEDYFGMVLVRLTQGIRGGIQLTTEAVR